MLRPLMLFALRGGFAVYYSFITVDDDDDFGVHWIHEESFCVVGPSLSLSLSLSDCSFSLASFVFFGFVLSACVSFNIVR